MEHQYLLGSDRVETYDKRLFSRAMWAYYGKRVVLLIDEYDVPVAKSNSHGYYLEMLDVMKGLLQVLKDNQALDFAVITGCLKIAKESIFTGAGYMVDSNKEHGEGRSDVVVYDPVNGWVAVFEAKYSKKLESLDLDCDRALKQIDQKMYLEEYEGQYDQSYCYGISFFKKRCLVKKGKNDEKLFSRRGSF